jgi:glutamine cyclotransferase
MKIKFNHFNKISLFFFSVLPIILVACTFQNFLMPSGLLARQELSWISIGETPQANQKYTPQGLTIVGEYLILAESWQDEKTKVYRLSLGNKNYHIKDQFEMPPEAVHTSGLTWDGKYLWAIDYISSFIYKIDLYASFKTGKAVVLAKMDSGLKGASSITYFQWKQQEYMAIADFMNSGKTYLVPLDKLLKPGLVVKNSKLFYKNGYFVQGLAWDGKYLYESNNNIFRDSIYKININLAIKTKSFSSAIISTFSAPGTMVEDLAINGKKIITTDESAFEIYEALFDNN